MKSKSVEVILLILVVFIVVAANEAPLAFDQKNVKGFPPSYPVIYPRSYGSYDGWVRETGEFTNIGGTLNATGTVVNIGDDAAKRQYRAILHFNTASTPIPPAAVIVNVVLRLRLQGYTGSNPFLTFGPMIVDMRKPSFGTATLVSNDFQALPGKAYVASFSPTPVAFWYKAVLNATGRAYINRNGTTQFRIYFKKDDDNDLVADYVRLFSGNALASLRPKLEIQYYVP